MKIEKVLHADGTGTVFVTVNSVTEIDVCETMTLGEWSKLIANPTETEEKRTA